MVQKTAGAEGRTGNGPTGQREYGREASGSRNRAPHLTDPDGGGEGHSRGNGETTVLEACVRSVPAQGEWSRIFSPNEWHRRLLFVLDQIAEKKDFMTHRDTSDIQRRTRHEANANPKVRLSPRCRIIPSETHDSWLAGSKLRLFLVAQRANSVRNTELEQWTYVTEGSGAVLQRQGQRRTRRTHELSLEENDSSRSRGEGMELALVELWTEQPRGVWWGKMQPLSP